MVDLLVSIGTAVPWRTAARRIADFPILRDDT
jgi:hypothetical protein